jgi:hypothetical protein
MEPKLGASTYMRDYTIMVDPNATYLRKQVSYVDINV